MYDVRDIGIIVYLPHQVESLSDPAYYIKLVFFLRISE